MIKFSDDEPEEEMLAVFYGKKEIMSRSEFEDKIRKGTYPFDVKAERIN